MLDALSAPLPERRAIGLCGLPGRQPQHPGLAAQRELEILASEHGRHIPKTICRPGTEALDILFFQFPAAMLQAGAQFLLHRAHRDAEALGDLAVRNLVDPRGDHDGLAPARQFRQRRLQRRQLLAPLDLADGSRRLVGQLVQLLQFFHGEQARAATALVFGDVDRDLEQIGRRILHRRGIGHALDAQPGFLHGFVGQVFRAQPDAQALAEVLVFGENSSRRLADGADTGISLQPRAGSPRPRRRAAPGG